MPELPEVETVKVFLEKNVINEKTKSVKIENENLRFVITANVSQILSNSIISYSLRDDLVKFSQNIGAFSSKK